MCLDRDLDRDRDLCTVVGLTVTDEQMAEIDILTFPDRLGGLKTATDARRSPPRVVARRHDAKASAHVRPSSSNRLGDVLVRDQRGVQPSTERAVCARVPVQSAFCTCR